MLSPTEEEDIKSYLSKLPGVKISYPQSKSLACYSLSSEPFAFLELGKQTLRLSLRSDGELSKLLREKYEEVLPGHKLNPSKWNTIILSGQLSPNEIKALIDHSYALVNA